MKKFGKFNTSLLEFNKINENIEKYSVMRTVLAIERADVCLLMIDANDEKVADALKLEPRKEIRQKYGVAGDDFLINTGGKIDSFKKADSIFA